MSNLIHTRLEGENPRWVWPRVLCGHRGKENKTATHWKRSVPTCERCSVLRDLWLETQTKAPTIRRVREWWKAQKIEGTHP